MSNTEERKKVDNPRRRTLRLVLYLLVVVCIFLWDRERRARLEFEEFADFIIIPLTPEQLEEMKTAQERRNRLNSLMDGIAEAEGEEELRLCNELLDEFQDDQDQFTRTNVCWTMDIKAAHISDLTERMRFYETIIDKFCDMRDKDAVYYLVSVIGARLALSDSNAGKLAFCEDTLAKHGDRLVDRLSAHLLTKVAELTRDRKGKIDACDAVLARFLSSSDEVAFRLAVAAALDKMRLIDDAAEQLRLCDIVIDAFLKTPHKARRHHFRAAIQKKAELTGDPSLPLALWNRVIADNLSEKAVVQARAERLPLLGDDAERLAACDEFIAAHADSPDDYVRFMLTRAMLEKARLLTAPEEKISLLLSTIEQCGNITDSRARQVVRDAAAALVALDPASATALRHYDELENMTEKQRSDVLALEEKIRLVGDERERRALYDSILFETRGIPHRYFFFRLFRERTDLVDDESEDYGLVTRYETTHGDGIEPDVRMHLHLDKIVLTYNAGFTDYALRELDDVAEFCEKYLGDEENAYGASPAKDAERMSVMDCFGKAILAKSLSNGERSGDGEILALCEKYLAHPQPQPELLPCMNYIREKILAKKAELLGKNSRTPLDQI